MCVWRNRCHIFAQRAHKKKKRKRYQTLTQSVYVSPSQILLLQINVALHLLDFSNKCFIFICSSTAWIKLMSSGSWCKLLKHTRWNKPVNLELFGQNLIPSLFPSAVVPVREAGVLPGSKVKSNVFIAGYFFRALSEPRPCKWCGSSRNLLSKLTRGAQTDVMNINPF